MELELVPVTSSGLIIQPTQIDPMQVDLVLNINFGQYYEILEGNYVTFGLKQGELKVTLTNGEIPLKNIKLNNVFETVVEKEVDVEKGREKQVVGNLGINLGGSATGKESDKTGEKVKYKEYQVRVTGTLTEPTWIFEVKTHKQILQGLLQNTPLATIDIRSKPCKLVATFNVIAEHIFITDAAYLGISGITKKKTAIIEKAIIRRLLDEKLNLEDIPYLSRVELVYG
jgi:hypothetical protein